MENVERNYCVYMHTNKINGKKYVGITKKKPEERWLNGRGYRGNDHFYRAIKKYGWDNFDHDVLFVGLTSDEAGKKEIELIAKYNTTDKNFGYNIELGGNKKSVIVKKPVKQYLLDGKFLSEYDGAVDAAEAVRINSSDDIGACCRGTNKTAGGYIWRFADENLTEEHRRWCTTDGKIAYVEGLYRGVTKYSREGEFICDYKNVYDAANDTGGNCPNIVSCCRDRMRTANGFIWRYTGDELTPEHIKWCNYDKFDKFRKPVYQYDMNDKRIINEYISVKEASNKTNIPQSSIGQCCRGEKKHAGGYLWRYIADVRRENNIDMQVGDLYG